MASVDAVLHRLEQQLRKYKEKVQERHRDPDAKRQGARSRQLRRRLVRFEFEQLAAGLAPRSPYTRAATADQSSRDATKYKSTQLTRQERR